MSAFLTVWERQALEFLKDEGPDVPGVVDCEEVFAAHLAFLALVERGLVSKGMGDQGPIYAITEAGCAALAAPTAH